MSELDPRRTWVGRLMGACLDRPLVVVLLVALGLFYGLSTAPFGELAIPGIARDPVPVDALPDTGENQQIVFTEWPGRSPQDVEDQVTYPLTVSLLGVPGVKTIRSTSMFGFSSINVIFEEDVDFYWSRSRVVEKLASLPPGTLPEAVRPALGPDATALGQVFWYVLEARDLEGRPVGGAFGLDELRSIQDFQVRYALASVPGVSEVASIGGFVREYQIDVDPDALRAHGVTLTDVFRAVRDSNAEVGARTLEVNGAEYVIRGLGFVEGVDDLRQAVVAVREGVPITVAQVAHVGAGPALRRGALDKGGAEAVGGVVVVRYGANPLAVIDAVKEKLAEIAPGLPRITMDDGSVAQVTVVPFYDRTGLIHETLDTLSTALRLAIVITFIVTLVMIGHFRSGLIVSSMLPFGVLLAFVAMKLFGVDANLVALAGIAIAIGTMVDVGIVLTENVKRHLDEAPTDRDSRRAAIHAGAAEVGGAVLTAVATTVVGFLPVFAMEGAEGKLFRPLAWTKTFALIASIVLALIVVPPMAAALMSRGGKRRAPRPAGKLGLRVLTLLVVAGLTVWLAEDWAPIGVDREVANIAFVALVLIVVLGGFWLFRRAYEPILRACLRYKALFLTVPAAIVLLGAMSWLGAETVLSLDSLPNTQPEVLRFLVLSVVVLAVVACCRLFGPRLLLVTLPALVLSALPYVWDGAMEVYTELTKDTDVFHALGVLLLASAVVLAAIVVVGPSSWPWAIAIGVAVPALLPSREPATLVAVLPLIVAALVGAGFLIPRLRSWPGAVVPVGAAIGFVVLYGAMAKTFPHGWSESRAAYALRHTFPGLGEEFLPAFDEGSFLVMPVTMAHASIGEALDVLQAQDRAIGAIPEVEDVVGKIGRVDSALDPAPVSMIETVVTYVPEWTVGDDGEPVRNWRDEIETSDDLWREIAAAAEYPGATTATKLGPIETRRVMLQTGMRAAMGVKVRGPDLETIERVGLEIERLLREVPQVDADTVFADRVVGKPYLEIDIDREAIARYGLSVRAVQDVIEVAIGGRPLTMSVEGRERYPIRVRYLRELRDRPEELAHILVPAPTGAQVPLGQLATIRYTPGPQAIKSEDTFLTSYVTFGKQPGLADVEVVEAARDFLEQARASGTFDVPPGVSYRFAGEYENQVRAAEKLRVVLPIALFTIFLLLYLQFRKVWSTALVFSGVFVAWGGGFILLWLWNQPWFLDFSLFGRSMQDLFQVGQTNLSVAVWVGFLALFGIATDDGVLMGTYLKQNLEERRPTTVEELRDAVVAAGSRRIRPCLMTTATTVLALLPVITSQGRGAEVMLPMALPSVGGMLVVQVSVFVVPTLWCAIEEWRLRRSLGRSIA